MNAKLKAGLCILMGMLSSSAFSQDVVLDNRCIVSVLNRAINVSLDGSFRLANVPANMGSIRARANCVFDGQTVSGATDFFQVPPRGTVEIGDFQFSNPDPVPQALNFVDGSGVLQINSTDTEYQLLVSALYSDGSSSDILDPFSGVNYLSSNPSIAEVDNTGVVRAFSSGTALITVRLEGAIAIRIVEVVLGNDLDEDGLPDDFELANGLDPSDPVDAFEDIDKDGLSAFDEFTLGTDLRIADTDGDGIEDGEETVAGEDGFTTDPLLADTDNDLINDGLEVSSGSDPTDPDSRNLAGALDTLEIVQGDFEIIFNGLQTEATAQLTVLGHLLDGTQIDLTDTTEGTAYSSSDLTIVSFGLESGELFASQNGMAEITATNNGFSDTVTVTVTSFNPLPISALDLPGEANEVDVSGTYAYVAAGSAGLQIVDLLDPENPYVISSLPSADESLDVRVYGQWAYVADGTGGLMVVDISDPSNPQLLTRYQTDGVFQDLGVDGGYLVVAKGATGLEVLSISDPSDPLFLAKLVDIGDTTSVAINAIENLIVALADQKLRVIDSSEPLNPTVRWNLDTTVAKQLAIDGRYVYMAAGTEPYQVARVDIENNFETQFVNVDVRDPLNATNVELAEGGVFFTDLIFSAGASFINNTDLNNLFYQSVVDLRSLGPSNSTGIAANSQYVYLVGNHPLEDTHRFFVGQYVSFQDAGGLAPTVNLVNLGQGQGIAEGSTYVFNVQAEDDIGVQSVQILLDGVEYGTDSSYPYNIPVLLPQQVGNVDVTARATDFGGNLSTSIAITIELKSDIDLDGLIDELEAGEGTDINDPDSDDDTLLDGREIELGTDPLQADTDGDGVSDADEARQGTDPTSSGENWVNETLTLGVPITTGSITMEDSQVDSNFAVTVLNDFVVTGGASTVDILELSVGGKLTVDGTTLTLKADTVSVGQLELLNGATLVLEADTLSANSVDVLVGSILTVPLSTRAGVGYTPLELNVSGRIYVDSTSAIDVSGKGFDARRVGPNNSDDSSFWGCHAGIRSAVFSLSRECTYGRYNRAQFAGSGGNPGAPGAGDGGGFVRVVADQLLLDGSLLADGGLGSTNGAGGGVDLEVNELSGSGLISASGLNGSNDGPSGGGRISIRSDLSQWSGSVAALGGKTNRTVSYRHAGAGTIYLQDSADTQGSLIIDNELVGLGGSRLISMTQIEHVGRHTITGVTDLGNGSWEVSIGSNAWEPTNAQFEYGVQGLNIDLDASDEIGSIYTIESNTENTLTINTTDDLSSIVGQELIGVHQFERLIIKDGALVDFGGDRVEINDLAGSEVSDATVQNLEMPKAAIDYFAQNNVDGVLKFEPLISDSLTISAPGIEFDALALSMLTIDGVTATIASLEIADVTLTNGELISSDGQVQISNNLDLLSGSTLTVPSSTRAGLGYTPLQLTVLGEIHIDATSSIDLTGKGFDVRRYGPDNSNDDSAAGRRSCHGGDRSTFTGTASAVCQYGRYARARFAGSGDFNANTDGGGFVRILASVLRLNGSIIVLGGTGNSNNAGAAGGVDLDVGTLSGTGIINAEGRDRGNSGSSSGGRVSIRGDLSQWQGSVNARGGQSTNNPNGNRSAGAGTIYMQDTQDGLGSLIVDNQSTSIPRLGLTQIEHVGRHEIIAVSDLGNGSWEVSVGSNIWETTNTQFEFGIQDLKIDLDASDEIGSIYTIESNTENTLTINTTDDLSSIVGQELIGVHQFERLIIKDGALVDFGGDRVEINDLAGSEVSDATVQNLEMPKAAIDYFAQNNVDGFFKFEPFSVDNLSISASGIRFDELRVSGTLMVTGALESDALSAMTLDISNGSVLAGSLSATDLSVTNGSLTSIDGDIQVTNDIDILNSSVLTVSKPTTSGYTALQLNVGGQIYVDSSSSVDVTGKGFSSRRYGPDNSESATQASCHAGSRGGWINQARPVCGYGRYSRATFAGSGAVTNDNGGGFVKLVANRLYLDGSLAANGGGGGSYAGAGGGIDIEVNELLGIGSIQASGKNANNYNQSSAGRISVRSVDVSQWSGSYEAKGGFSSNTGVNSAWYSAAGTVFVQIGTGLGSLMLDNAGNGNASRTNLGLTQIEHIGHHVITGATDLGNGSWELNIGTNAWRSTDTEFEYGIQGLKVDLDASDEIGPIYIVESNAENTLIVNTTDDLSTVVGQELIGVHQFERLIIKDGAQADFGGDRVEINDLANSNISDAVIQNVVFTEAGLQHFLSNNVDGVFNLGDVSTAGVLNIGTDGINIGNIQASELSVSAPNFSATEINVTGDVTFTGSAVTVEKITSQTVDLISGSVLSVPENSPSGYSPLRINVTGEFYIDATSSIDLDGKGFDAGRFGPGNSTNVSQAGCHAGSRGLSAGCGYGRYTKASFAGSGGEGVNNADIGHGGGYVEIIADSLFLDGSISANGFIAGFGSGSAGGGISIDVDSILGAGSMTTNGANRSTSYTPAQSQNGGGGRISIEAADFTGFTGTYQSRGGTLNEPGGSGTVYLRDTDLTNGSLLLDNVNPGTSTSAAPTVIEHIGRHAITAVTDLGNGAWQLTIGTNEWQASNTVFEYGIQGLKVDLDASNVNGPIYTVDSNAENSLNIVTTDDLSGVVAQELIGVHQFESLVVKEGAVVDFGGDRIEVNDLVNSEVTDAVIQNQDTLSNFPPP